MRRVVSHVRFLMPPACRRRHEGGTEAAFGHEDVPGPGKSRCCHLGVHVQRGLPPCDVPIANQVLRPCRKAAAGWKVDAIAPARRRGSAAHSPLRTSAINRGNVRAGSREILTAAIGEAQSHACASIVPSPSGRALFNSRSAGVACAAINAWLKSLGKFHSCQATFAQELSILHKIEAAAGRQHRLSQAEAAMRFAFFKRKIFS